MTPRLRYAPSPTGHLHIGNARTALFNYLYARKHHGRFIIRIEDTDVERNVETGIENQLGLLKWLGVDWDESIDKDGGYGPYRQLERLDAYERYAETLIRQGHAYKCYCTPEELETIRKQQLARGEDKLHYPRVCLGKAPKEAPYAVRFHVPAAQEYRFKDMVKGEVVFKSSDIGDWVILKQNGIPTYNFACAVDDKLMDITHVLRGEDHLTNTPRQLMVLDALNAQRPVYGHMTLIVDSSGKKLSKRNETVLQFIEQYRALGYLPEALFNFIALLGWSPDEENEIFTRDELVERFDERRLSTSPATFDAQKLRYVNNRHIKKLDDPALFALILPFLQQAGIGRDKGDIWKKSLLEVFKDRLTHGAHIVDLYRDFFELGHHFEDEALAVLQQPDVDTLLETFQKHIRAAGDIGPEQYRDIINVSGKDANVKGKMLFMPLRAAASGATHGPDLPHMLHLIGKETLLERLENARAVHRNLR